MSIYPVRLSEWFPAKPKKDHKWASPKERRQWHETAKLCVEMNTCCVCGKKPDFEHAWGMHAIPWGYGWGEIWCSEECLNAPEKKAEGGERRGAKVHKLETEDQTSEGRGVNTLLLTRMKQVSEIFRDKSDKLLAIEQEVRELCARNALEIGASSEAEVAQELYCFLWGRDDRSGS